MVRKIASSVFSFMRLSFFVVKCKVSRCDWGWFDNGFYSGKRVIVIGPAESSLSYLSGEEIDRFDLVVRINKSPLSLAGKEAFIGSRTDVLYHCCDEDPITGGGGVNSAILKGQGVKRVVYTYAEPTLLFNFYRVVANNSSLSFFRLAKKYYWDLKGSYSARMPTTGLQALNHLLDCDFEELHVTGFTFFKSAYADGYRDEFKSADKAAGLAVSGGNHNPDDELKLFKEIYAKHSLEKKIYVDRELSALISN